MSIFPLDPPEHWKKKFFNDFCVKVILTMSDKSMETNVPPILKVKFPERLEAISPGAFPAFNLCSTP